MPDLLTSIDTDLLRRLLALALLELGALAFVTAPGGRRRWLPGLRRYRPKSDHWAATLGLTGVPGRLDAGRKRAA